MKANYSDIKALTEQEPQWFDSNGVPRYCAFSPEHSPNIYADEVALLEVECQGCNATFQVEVHSDISIRAARREWAFDEDNISLEDQIKKGTVTYGDPPIHPGCGSGLAMLSITARVAQFWKLEHGDWCRVRKLENAVQKETL